MHNSHHHLLHFHLNREFTELYITSVVRAFCLALVGVFVPAYLVSLGYSLNFVISYFLFIFVTGALITPPLTQLGAKIGFKHAILASMPFHIVHFFLLRGLEGYAAPLWYIALVALTFRISQSLYWPAFHIDFIRSSDEKHRAEELGTLQVTASLLNICAPLLGGIIIYSFGFQVLFFMVSFLLLLAPLPLFFSPELAEKVDFRLSDVFSKENRSNTVAFIVEGIVSVSETLIWPLFIYITLNSFLSLGILNTILTLAATLLTLIIGRFSDKIDKRKIIKWGAILYSLSWYGRPIVASFFPMAALTSYSGLAKPVLTVPYHALFYNKAAKHNPAGWVLYRETCLFAGRALVAIIMLITGSFTATFIGTGLASLAFIVF